MVNNTEILRDIIIKLPPASPTPCKDDPTGGLYSLKLPFSRLC